ncbi:hypothetical protein [Stenotrophomonas phage IME-SM1]|uniref:Uncharacterized protein n=1 Tax=Stenotrophomonas phage IME-SM1 TaxID=1654717 RepID=A0A0H4IPD7_9CAUD|nr:hypothetical protein KMC40_gp143 [Stenotrophomonas phage IME-SM1]AKO61615.1 hypothetical protein [Stenotrophomonas phage IME-SM1]QXN67321.1 hypothetical protein [Stenotrophomonas phage BUCT608]QYC97458.1 hypothetical protein [Stenotrophomonas phage BUCT608]
MNTNPKIYGPYMGTDSWGDEYVDMRWHGRLDTVKDTKWIVDGRYVKAEDYLKLASVHKKLEAKYARQQRYVSVVRKVLYAMLMLNPTMVMRQMIQTLLNKGEWKKQP